MTRYMLGPRLGGEEVELLKGDPPASMVLVRMAGGGLLCVDRGTLIRMDPPPEPPPNTTVIIKGLNNSDTRRDAFTRTGDDITTLQRWYWHDGRDWITWEQVYDKGNPIVLTEATK